MKSILVAPSSFGNNSNEPIKKLENLGYKIIYNPYGRKISKSELEKIFLKNNIIAVIAGLEEYTTDIIKNSELRVISRLGSGMNNIDFKSVKEKKIKLINTADAPSDAVAELTVSMAIFLSRDIMTMDNDMKKNKWKRSYGSLLKDKNILIVGYGKIGKKVAKIMKLLGANILICDPYLKNKNIFKIGLKEGLKKADIISLHTNGSDKILDEKNMTYIKKNSILLNSSRGTVICEKTVFKFLKEKKIKSAWFDVFLEEPYKGPLNKLSNVVLTPHISSYTIETRIKMENEAVDNLQKLL
tara:strand:+ start:182 stop:1078 length:897 start_codon:yes stop_codon:yes gene_type:complete